MRYAFSGGLALLFLTVAASAQVSPTPVINNEIRDPTSMRSRGVELERVKKDANQITFDSPTKEQAAKFAQIKEDFESIQKLDAEIIKAYSLEKEINFGKIADAATEISRRAARLDVNLFVQKSEKPGKTKKTDKTGQKNLRQLIVDLDSLIGNFVASPIFTNNKLVDLKMSEKSQSQLEQIIKVSEALAGKARDQQ